jgi:cobalt-precorrin 5A hydrolase
LPEWTPQAFAGPTALVFVGASGIAVRAVAPHLRQQDADPAVVVRWTSDGRFAIPRGSGHLGGANALARDASRTGVRRRWCRHDDRAPTRGASFAVDEWARAQGLRRFVGTQEKSRRVSSASCWRAARCALRSDWPELEGQGAQRASSLSPEGRATCCVSIHRAARTLLRLVPRIAVLGVGCRRGHAGGGAGARLRAGAGGERG